MKKLPFVVVAFSLTALTMALVSGCASADKIRDLRAGMTADEVRTAVGTPQSITNKGTKQIWVYQPVANSCAVVLQSSQVLATACANNDELRTPASSSRAATEALEAARAAQWAEIAQLNSPAALLPIRY